MNRRTLLQGLGAAALPAAAWAQAPLLPSDGKVARFVVGSAAGGPADVQARSLADAIRRVDGTTLIVENRPGAGGRLAVQAVKAMPANGLGFLLAPGWQLTLASQTAKSPGYDPLADFITVGGYALQEYALIVGPASPAKTIGDFVSWAKAHPGRAQCGSGGVGSMGHLVAAMFQRSAGIEITDVPYKGAAPALQDVQAGHTPGYVGALGDMIRMHKDGSARVLATSGARRSKFLPDVPTFDEAGFAAVRAVDWTGLLAPAKTPRAVVDRYAKLVSAALSDAEFNALLTRVGVEAHYQSPAELGRRLKLDVERMKELVAAFGLKGSTS